MNVVTCVLIEFGLVCGFPEGCRWQGEPVFLCCVRVSVAVVVTWNLSSLDRPESSSIPVVCALEHFLS